MLENFCQFLIYYSNNLYFLKKIGVKFCTTHRTIFFWKNVTIFRVLGLAIYIKKYLKVKSRTMEAQIFHHAKNVIFKKNPLKETKTFQDITTLYN